MKSTKTAESPAREAHPTLMGFSRKTIVVSALAAGSVFLGACRMSSSSAQAAAPPPPPGVEVVTVEPQDVPIYSEYAAETYARDMVEVRGRVDGYIEKRLFQIGSDVKAGAGSIRAGLRPYQADVAKAKGDLAQSAGESGIREAAGGAAAGSGGSEAGGGESAESQAGRGPSEAAGERGSRRRSRIWTTRSQLCRRIRRTSIAKQANVEQSRLSTRRRSR